MRTEIFALCMYMCVSTKVKKKITKQLFKIMDIGFSVDPLLGSNLRNLNMLYWRKYGFCYIKGLTLRVIYLAWASHSTFLIVSSLR